MYGLTQKRGPGGNSEPAQKAHLAKGFSDIKLSAALLEEQTLTLEVLRRRKEALPGLYVAFIASLRSRFSTARRAVFVIAPPTASAALCTSVTLRVVF